MGASATAGASSPTAPRSPTPEAASAVTAAVSSGRCAEDCQTQEGPGRPRGTWSLLAHTWPGHSRWSLQGGGGSQSAMHPPVCPSAYLCIPHVCPSIISFLKSTHLAHLSFNPFIVIFTHPRTIHLRIQKPYRSTHGISSSLPGLSLNPPTLHCCHAASILPFRACSARPGLRPGGEELAPYQWGC